MVRRDVCCFLTERKHGRSHSMFRRIASRPSLILACSLCFTVLAITPPQDHLLGQASYLGSASFQARGRKQGGRTPSTPLSRNSTTLLSLHWLELSPWSSVRWIFILGSNKKKEDQIFNRALSDCTTGHNLSRELWPKIGSQMTRN